MKKDKIILYESKETNFNHNGIRILKPLECYINRNLIDYTYDLDMVYPIDNINHWEDILEGRIIKANNQLFRIVYTDKSVITNTISIYAKHIFFDLQNNFIEDTNVISKNGNMALAQLLQKTSFEHNFTSYSDISNVNNFRCVRKNVLDALLGDDTSFITRWGGEFDVDNFQLSFTNTIGEDKGYKIKYGKNLTGLSFKTDYTDVVTRIRPIGFDGIELDNSNKYVDSPNINNYSMPIIREIKYEHVKWTGSPNYEEREDDDTSSIYDTLELAQAELRRLAGLEFTENEIDLPKITCEVNFIELSNTEEYSQFKNLEKISLGDIVTIIHEPLNVNMRARCISYKYNCLKQQYDEITIGHYQKNFFKETSNNNTKLENNDLNLDEQFKSVYSQAITKMSEMMNNSMNGYIVLNNSEILIMDTDDKTTATHVWKFNSSGIAFSSTGYKGEYTVGMTMDGHINGALITAGTIKGDMLESGSITTRELAVEIQNTIKTAMTQEKTQALITANLNEFSSNLSQTFITEENATKQIQTATEKAVEQATQSIISNAVTESLKNVNDQLDNKLIDYTDNILNPSLQTAMNETLQDSKDYVTNVTANYYTKNETDSKISQTRESIELGISSIYETKVDSEIRIVEAIEGVTVGAVNRVFGTAEEKTIQFKGGSNETFVCYDISSDITDKDVIISFEYDLKATVQNGSSLKFQAYYMSTSNKAIYSPVYEFIKETTSKELDLKNQVISFTARFDALQQDAQFRFRADGIIGTFTVKKAQIKVGNKVTEWSVAPEDIETNANNYTVQQLASYYTKVQTDSKISALQDSINLKVSDVEEDVAEIQTSIEQGLGVKLTNYYTKEEADAQIELTKKSITSTVEETYVSKLELDKQIIGGENLITNSNFDYGLNNWNGSSSYSVLEGKLYYNVSDLTVDTWRQRYTNAIAVNDYVGQEMTLSFDYKIKDKSKLSTEYIAYIRFFDNETSTSQDESISHYSIKHHTDYKNNTFRRISKTVTVPDGAKYVRVAGYISMNGEVWWDNFQLEIGNTPTAWKASSQDSLLYTNQTTSQISDELGDLSQIVATNTGSDSITSAMKLKLIAEYNDAIVVYDRLNNMYQALGDTSFKSLPTELETAKTNLENIITPLKSTVNNADDRGLSDVLEKFNKFYEIAEALNQSISNSLAGYSQETRTQVEQLADNYKITASKIETIGESVNNLTTSFNFNTDGLTIKSTKNATKYIKLDNDSLDFMDNNTMVAQISDQKLTITNSEVKNEMKIGNIRIKPSGIGGIMFIYE